MISREHKKDIKLYYILYILALVSIPLLITTHITYSVLNVRYILHYNEIYEDMVIHRYLINSIVKPMLSGFIITGVVIKFFIVPKSKMWEKLVLGTVYPEQFEKYKTLRNIRLMARSYDVELNTASAVISSIIMSVIVIFVLVLTIVLSTVETLNLTDVNNGYYTEYTEEVVDTSYQDRLIEELKSCGFTDVKIEDGAINEKCISGMYDGILTRVYANGYTTTKLYYVVPFNKGVDTSNIEQRVNTIHDILLSCENIYITDNMCFPVEVPQRVFNELRVLDGEDTSKIFYVLETSYQALSSKRANDVYGMNTDVITICVE